MDRDKTVEFITIHEGKRNTAYTDTAGLLTVGIGFNLMRDGAEHAIQALNLKYEDVCSGECKLSNYHIDYLFQHDLSAAMEDALDAVDNFGSLPDDVQMAIVDMIFNLGYNGFRKFKKLIGALEQLDFCAAANEMQNSKWAQQVPNRAKDDIQLVKQYCHSQ